MALGLPRKLFYHNEAGVDVRFRTILISCEHTKERVLLHWTQHCVTFIIRIILLFRAKSNNPRMRLCSSKNALGLRQTP